LHGDARQYWNAFWPDVAKAIDTRSGGLWSNAFAFVAFGQHIDEDM
jgi:hypothetical protein